MYIIFKKYVYTEKQSVMKYKYKFLILISCRYLICCSLSSQHVYYLLAADIDCMMHDELLNIS